MTAIGCVILAAGGSLRLGQPKQLLLWEGKPLVQRMAEAAKAAGCSPVVVVLGSQPQPIRDAMQKLRVEIVENKNWQAGMGTSIRSGVQFLLNQPKPPDAIVLLVCDQPHVTADTISELITLHRLSQKPIIASDYANTLGVPALFDHSYYSELLFLPDDGGAKSIIRSHPDRVAGFSFPLGTIDIDTAADYEKLKETLPTGKPVS